MKIALRVMVLTIVLAATASNAAANGPAPGWPPPSPGNGVQLMAGLGGNAK